MSKAEQIADMMTRGTWTGRRSAQRLAVTWGWQPSRVVQLAAEVAAAPCPKAAERAAAGGAP